MRNCTAAPFVWQVDREFLDTEIRLLKHRVDQYKANEVDAQRSKGELDAQLQVRSPCGALYPVRPRSGVTRAPRAVTRAA